MTTHRQEQADRRSTHASRIIDLVTEAIARDRSTPNRDIAIRCGCTASYVAEIRAGRYAKKRDPFVPAPRYSPHTCQRWTYVLAATPGYGRAVQCGQPTGGKPYCPSCASRHGARSRGDQVSLRGEHRMSDAIIRKMFLAGGTYTDIADQLGTTRNAIAGRCRRLGLRRNLPKPDPPTSAISTSCVTSMRGTRSGASLSTGTSASPMSAHCVTPHPPNFQSEPNPSHGDLT